MSEAGAAIPEEAMPEEAMPEEAMPEAKPEEAMPEVKPEDDAGPVKEEEDAKPAPPWETICAKLRGLLEGADMDTMTERQLRKSLEAEFGCDLKEQKKLIRDEVEKYLSEKHGEEEEEEEEEEEDEDEDEDEEQPKKKKSRAAPFGSILSAELSEFLGGVEQMPRTQVVKKIWEHIKEHNLQYPDNKRKIRLDDKMALIFKAPLDMLNMNKQLSRHCFTAELQDSSPAKPKAKGKAKPAAGKRAREEGGAAKEKPAKKKTGGGNGFTKPCRLSPQLAAMVGKSECPRHEVVKSFWAYVKGKDLQDPKNKQVILCDDVLKAITGCKTIKGFGAMKYFKDHMFAE